MFFCHGLFLSSKMLCRVDKFQSFSWLNLCSQSKCSRTSMFVPITGCNLRDVQLITKTVPNYAHLWVPWLNLVQLGAATWWRIQQLQQLSPSFLQNCQKLEQTNQCESRKPTNINNTCNRFYDTRHLVFPLWPCWYLEHIIKWCTVVIVHHCMR